MVKHARIRRWPVSLRNWRALVVGTCLSLAASIHAENAAPVTDLTSALALAAQQGKRLFVHYGSASCGACQVLNGYIASGAVSLPGSNFVFCSLDAANPINQAPWELHYSVLGTPPLVVIAETNGQQLLARGGYGTAAQYQALIDQSYTLQQPPNDLFAGRIRLPDGPAVTTNLLSALAAREPGEPPNPEGTGGASIWWEWVCPSNGVFVVSTEGSAFGTLLAVYNGASLNSLSLAASDRASGALGASRLTLDGTAGAFYRMSVDGVLGTAGQAQLSIRPAGPPPNDAFPNATTISGWSNRVVGWNHEASKEDGEAQHAGEAGGHSVWWAWTPTSTGVATVSTHGSTFDTLLAVYQGTSLAAMRLVGANDDQGLERTSAVDFTAIAGETYRIAVDGFRGATGMVVVVTGGPIGVYGLQIPEMLPGGMARLRLTAPIGQTNVLEISSNMMAWTPLATNVQSAATNQHLDPQAAGQTWRFYRARRW